MRPILLATAFTAALTALPAAAQETLKTGLDGTFAPHAFPKLGGGIEGFNVDLAEAIAKRLGKKIDIQATQFSGLLPALQAGTYDFVIAPTTVTKDRAENLLFTEGYMNTDYQFLVKKGGPKVVKLEDLKGKTVAVNKGSIYDQWARELEGKIGWKVESYGTQLDAVQAVLSGRADANVGGHTGVQWAVKRNPQLELSYYHKTGLVWAIPVRKGNTAMRDMLDDVIICMKRDGTLVKLHEKWLGTKPEAGSATLVEFPGYGQPGFTGHDAREQKPKC
jgi:polar amino acid transport system substrate-binding protein